MTSHSLRDTLQPPSRAVWRWYGGSVQVPVERMREQLMPLTENPRVCRVQAVS